MRTRPFKKGDRLRLSALGLRHFPARVNVLATVTGAPRNPTQVTVVFDGFASRETLAALFFEDEPVTAERSTAETSPAVKGVAPCK